MSKSKRIILSGGGTLGPVTPLLAIVDLFRENEELVDFAWIGTRCGIERMFVQTRNIRYYAIPSARWRRYRDVRNIVAPFLFCGGFVAALFILARERPSLVVSAGGFVSAPVAWAAWLLRVPVLLYEMDVRQSLTNRLIRPVATKVISVWPRTGAVAVGSLVRSSFFESKNLISIASFGIPEHVPVVLIMGGGTGAQSINELVSAARQDLSKTCFVIHLTGRGKNESIKAENYLPLEMVDAEMPALLRWADLVVARAGMGTICELASQAKATMLIPIPDTHQEENVAYLATHEAVFSFSQADTPAHFATEIQRLLADPDQLKRKGDTLRNVVPDGRKRVRDTITDLLAPT